MIAIARPLLSAPLALAGEFPQFPLVRYPPENAYARQLARRPGARFGRLGKIGKQTRHNDPVIFPFR